MCSLPLHKPRSQATLKLSSVLKLCQLNSIKEDNLKTKHSWSCLNPQQRMQDIAVLELAKLAVKRWCIERNEASTRVKLVETFLRGMSESQTNLIKMDNQLFLRHMPFTNGIKIWRNPVYNVPGLKAYLKTDEQKKLFDELCEWQAELNVSTHLQQQPTSNKFCYAILMPILNFIFEWDIIFDGCDVCFNLASLV